MTVQHCSGASFTPGAPLHSTCLGSPEFYRRNEGVWMVGSKIIVPPASIRGFIHRDGPGYKRKHKSGNDASVTFILLTTGASVLCFINLSFIKHLLSG